MTFSGGLIDLFLFGILQGNAKTNWLWIVVVGVGYFVVYYVLFSFLIRRLNLKTPGREEGSEIKLYRRSDVEARKAAGQKGSAEGEQDGRGGSQNGIHTGSQEESSHGRSDVVSAEESMSAAICRGLGGKDNISDIDCCATRLRCTVFEAGKVEDAVLKATGASGVIRKGNGVQIIYGPRVTVIKSDLEDYLDTFIGED